MLPGKRDAEGRLYVTSAAISSETSFQGGIPVSPLGQVHISPNTPTIFANGFGMLVSNQLSTSTGSIVGYLEGIPRTLNGAIKVQLNQTPAPTDPYVGGIRIGPLGGVYITDAVPT